MTTTQKALELRDKFAMAALQGMLSTAGAPCIRGLGGCEHITAKEAYKIADAMLKARGNDDYYTRSIKDGD